MNHHIVKLRNISKIKTELKTYKKKQLVSKPKAKSVKCNVVNSSTLTFRMTHYKIFKTCSIKLPRLESSVKMFNPSKKVKVVLKRQILKPKIKISSRVANMFKRDCYVYMWNLHPHSKEMLIRSTLDPYTFIPIKVNFRVKGK